MFVDNSCTVANVKGTLNESCFLNIPCFLLFPPFDIINSLVQDQTSKTDLHLSDAEGTFRSIKVSCYLPAIF